VPGKALIFAATISLYGQAVVKQQGFVPFSDAPIHYRSENLDDPIARLQKKLDYGQLRLDYDPIQGYLRSIMDALGVPISSQTLVFSKTSFQYPNISPEKPRALYFNDDVYVGRVHQGKSLEFVSFDPMQGAIFYVMDEHQVDHPRFERAELDCIQCHVASSTRGVPGVMLRSIFTRPNGAQAGGTPAFITGQESPFKDRWGGWYVTGYQGSHMGNSVDDLGSSDVVAHLVLAHQTQMHNLITLTNYQTRLGKPFEQAAEQLVRYLLFVNEAPIEGVVDTSSQFAKDFTSRGPRDASNRSLRDFDLHKRIFKYPCSYLIYSESFDSIPEPAKGFIYHRLFEVLTGSEFASLSTEDRRAVLEILVATKPGLPDEWKQFVNNTERKSTSMKLTTRNLAAAGAMVLGIGGFATAGTLDGRWAATLDQGGVIIPFRLDISTAGNKVTGTLFSGDEKETTTSASVQDGKVELNFEHYLTSIKAVVKDGELDGQVEVTRRSGNSGEQRPASAFHAKRYVAPSAEVSANAPSIDGVWEIPHDSPKGEKAWRLIVKQNGAEISTTVLRVDGDTGALTGSWQGDKFVASHFDGARPGLIEITPQKDGSLEVKLNTPPRTGTMVAYRPEVARAKGLPEPANYLTHTTVRDPNEVFTFGFPDTTGKIQSNEDARYKGKVVLAIVTGTWCPNCHDEAQYLVQLYAKYHDKGLEIVALDFEEPDQQQSLKRVNAFIKQYGVPYPYLIAGAPDDMWDKIPQAVNLNTWPATLFIGRDGRVKATHSGFASPASGVYNTQLKQQFTSTIERLLSEPGEPSTAAFEQ
jgi:thiol-disulfide isomerase/thioredoxin